MCIVTPTLMMMAASTAVSVGGSMAASSAAKKNGAINAQAQTYEGSLNKEMRYMEAEDVTNQAQTEADKIREQAIAYRGAQTVQQAASGVVIGEGTAQALLDRTSELATADVLATLYSGTNKATAIKQGADLQQDASVRNANATMEKANAESSAYMMKAGGSLLSGAGGIYDKGVQSGWFKTK